MTVTSKYLDRPLRSEEEARRAIKPLGCHYCEGEPEPGWLETDNNGPIVPCPVCSPELTREEGNG